MNSRTFGSCGRAPGRSYTVIPSPSRAGEGFFFYIVRFSRFIIRLLWGGLSGRAAESRPGLRRGGRRPPCAGPEGRRAAACPPTAGKFPKKFPPPLHTGVQLSPNRGPLYKRAFPEGTGEEAVRRRGGCPGTSGARRNRCNGKTLYRNAGRFFCQTALRRTRCKVAAPVGKGVPAPCFPREFFAVFLCFSPVFPSRFSGVFTVPAVFPKNCGEFSWNLC